MLCTLQRSSRRLARLGLLNSAFDVGKTGKRTNVLCSIELSTENCAVNPRAPLCLPTPFTTPVQPTSALASQHHPAFPLVAASLDHLHPVEQSLLAWRGVEVGIFLRGSEAEGAKWRSALREDWPEQRRARGALDRLA